MINSFAICSKMRVADCLHSSEIDMLRVLFPAEGTSQNPARSIERSLLASRVSCHAHGVLLQAYTLGEVWTSAVRLLLFFFWFFFGFFFVRRQNSTLLPNWYNLKLKS